MVNKMFQRYAKNVKLCDDVLPKKAQTCCNKRIFVLISSVKLRAEMKPHMFISQVSPILIHRQRQIQTQKTEEQAKRMR
ncbi:Cystic fibrosis transmembrane conductance regulator [Frankliniella fusca]|uniref:Cystic fibrosis transmembrane conductance regulator n=1 Tax=Frankliniella fusca TaxID=407009 RepID=A0AAE1H099_9NEOP|nr:Cystic fibrosis transmembrane conductance regulator [Frankliniella fusca]